MSDDILPLLKVHEYFRGVSDEALQELMRHAQVTHNSAGSVVHEANVVCSTELLSVPMRSKALRISWRSIRSSPSRAVARSAEADPAACCMA